MPVGAPQLHVGQTSTENTGDCGRPEQSAPYTLYRLLYL
jgi:hypothetical protein